MEKQRRSVLKKLLASVAGIAGFSAAANAADNSPTEGERTAGSITYAEDDQQVPLFSGHVKYNGLVYIAGKGAHVAPFEIKAHTEIVLKELEAELIKAGSSMEKVLKVTVYLNDIADYKGMNEVYKGRFGKNPPVRTTVAVAKGGVPGDSLVEMDCIAIAGS
ncbi:MAG: RidA family protein [Chitinophagaceae bacterium]|nr:RidA family protein [Chitinophagaceae bacterium]